MGWFEGENVILIDGEILQIPAPNPPHDMALTLADYALKAIFAIGFTVRVQMGLALRQATDPIPDIAVVSGSPRDYVKHPSTALLIVEVSDSTMDYDTTDKASLYAAAQIADYWVINLTANRLEIRRNPIPDPAERFGWRYADVSLHTTGDIVSALAAPNAQVRVADLLP
jgi:Uma2 family endonuclease